MEQDKDSRVRATLYEEELSRQKRYLLNNSYLVNDGPSKYVETNKEIAFDNSITGKAMKHLEGNDLRNEGTDEICHDEDEEKKTKLGGIVGDAVRVREYIEKIVETIIGGPLDGTTVGKLSTDTAYLDMFVKYHGTLCRELARLGFILQQSNLHEKALEVDSKNSAHLKLKRLIKRIICEAMALPNIKDVLSRPKEDLDKPNENFKNKSYEDILATAILNKVIEKFQKEKTESDAIDGGRKLKTRHRKSRRRADDDQEDLFSDSDWSQSSRSDKLSLTIEEYIEEVTTAYEMSDEENYEISNYDPKARVPFPESGRTLRDVGTDDENSELEDQSSVTELVTSTSSWEENWLFQKKRLRSTPNAHHPVPVPMLVPNPSEDYRALVGGVDADELSDISDCTDLISEDMSSTHEENFHISAEKFKSFEYLNGQGDYENAVCNKEKLDSTTVESKKVEKAEIKVVEAEEKVTEMKEKNVENMIEVVEKCENTESNGSLTVEIPSQQDREFSVEHFPVFHHTSNNQTPSPGSDVDVSSEGSKESFIRCKIAEREKEKWKNAIELPENPYSQKNLEKRMERNSMEYFRLGAYIRDHVDFPEDIPSDIFNENILENQRFSRDYYINASKYPSGTSSPSSITQQSEKSEQVSRHLREDFPSAKGRLSKSIPNINFPKYFTADERFKNTYFLLKSQTTKNQHYSEVFKTSEYTNEDFARDNKKYSYGFHSLKLRPKHSSRKFSLDKELSDFEKKSLREDVNHTVLRAKGASPNFIMNPVFTPDVTSNKGFVGGKVGDITVKESSEESTRNDSDNESGSKHSESIVPYYRKFLRKSAKKADKKSCKVSQESGYGSDSLDYSSDSLECWRLTPPKTPEVVESDFVPILTNRRNKKEALRRTKSSFSGF